MTYNHLTTRELTLIAGHQGTKAYLLKRSQEMVYRVYRFLNRGNTINSTFKPINAINDVVGVNQRGCPKVKLTTSMNGCRLDPRYDY